MGGRKRSAENEADDAARGDEQLHDDAPTTLAGNKRRAETEADDRERGDEQQESGDAGMDSLGAISCNTGGLDTNECTHCGAEFNSRNLLFKHLYHYHDEDSEGIRLREDMQLDLSEAGCAAVKPIMAVEDFRGQPSPILEAK